VKKIISMKNNRKKRELRPMIIHNYKKYMQEETREISITKKIKKKRKKTKKRRKKSENRRILIKKQRKPIRLSQYPRKRSANVQTYSSNHADHHLYYSKN
jgi:hypothetical protein